MKAWVSVATLSSVRQDLILLSNRRLNPLSSTAPILCTDELAKITEPLIVILTSGVIFLSCAGWPMTRSCFFHHLI